MREIKFRAWVVDEYEEDGNTPKTFKMVNWFEQFFSDMSSVTGWGSDFPDKDCKEVFLMQYTGLKDKNGKEIYEGDILDWGFWHKGDGERGVVEFMKSWSSFALNFFSKHGGEGSDFLYKWIKQHKEHIAVIGNIYENKELLKRNNK